MAKETKQTTFVIIEEQEQQDKPTQSETTSDTTSTGTTHGSAYWDIPHSPVTNSPPLADSTTGTHDNANPYWEIPFPMDQQEEQEIASDISATGTSNSTDPAGEGILHSIRQYDQLRQDFPNDFIPPEDDNSNVELFEIPLLPDDNTDEIAFCHLTAIIPFTTGDQKPFHIALEDAAVIALAIQDLNSGNGILVPEIQGLNERCNVRFTTEWLDTEFQGGVALGHVVEQANKQTQPPCAFLGAYRSAVSMPMAIATGLFQVPQISAASTSASLDDASQYPLFGRTIPSDTGNAIPTIIYMHTVLGLQHVAIINVNDAFGNAYVEGMRHAAAIHAPQLKIHQVPLDEGQAAISAAVASVKAIEYQYIFMIVFTAETHDAIMTEAYQTGVAGDGQHVWIYADSFLGVLDGRTFVKDGPLHKSYRGSGMVEIAGGFPGMPKYDSFVQHVTEMDNLADLQTIGALFPQHDDWPMYDAHTYVTGQHESYLKDVTSIFAPFTYEAVVGLGLAACQAVEQTGTLAFTGQQHFDAFKNLSFTGISGPVVFDPDTGTRDPASALYKVNNYQEQFETDPETGEEVVRFLPVNTHLFQGGVWEQRAEYLFNDGTSNIPPELPPPPKLETGGTSIALVVVVPLVVLAVLGVVVFLFYENKRKNNDSVWEVDKKDIIFDDPPQIIGRGTFGLVLLGEYRGTAVAVKRVIPPQSKEEFTGGSESTHGPGMRSIKGSKAGVGMVSGVNSNRTRMSSWSGMSMLGSRMPANGKARKGSFGFQQSEAAQWKQMKAEFMEEMRYLSKLRHPCITTVMGAVTKGEPMLVMEYMDHGSLYDLLHNETLALEGELLMPLLRDITQGMRFLHASNPPVIHGDLKAANILVDSRYRGKVADFGLSQKENMGGTGTPFWMAPELLRGESANTVASDVYSFGILLYEVFSRRDPYDGEDAQQVLKLVADKAVRKRPPAPLHMPESIKGLMKDCLDDAPEKRPTCEEVDTRLKRLDAETLDGDQTNKKAAQVSLFDIFPRHIAEALRDGRTVEAEHKDSVTIFFSDIVGFTNISSELEPRKVARMLDRLYTKFDALSQQHDIFKVETIGDAYMAVTNLVKDQDEDHCKRIADFAIEAIEAANDTLIDEDDEEKGCVNIRVGFHSGPVVADVVGTRNPRYCLFGDTVNTASRMESNSEENRIHCSRAAAKLLQTQYKDLSMKSRGKVKIKGKGEMHTYWVNEGVRGKRLTMSVKESTKSGYFPILSDRGMTALAETSGELSSALGPLLQEHAPGNNSLELEPTLFGAAGEEV
ncbi:activated protein kinase catalytic subunit alpha-1 [Seminavis robusta]|uniref:Guanylate cyclase n=1 Tax=Seminavis robusta TaxID=568900 RepID=A0A9N8E7S8_9STRA|nr:activated protein kinase catalytic subunit alpha-1 [Seminavis robusta]|eukprot:Sro640_g179880.1 activated protein kinase catalytic subunit alpha-1 (1285) ;mRNA; f:31678-37082